MKVYHGSDVRVDVIDLTKSKPSRDFGRGFYVTNIYQQAEEMANRIADWHQTQPVVSEFDFEEYAFEDNDLRTLRFNTYTEEWLDFIILNRRNLSNTPAHDFDIAEGPVADDAISVRIKDYLQGKVSKEIFLEEVKHKTITHQICFCTDKSLQMIQRTDDNIGGDIYRIDDLIVQQLMFDYELSDKKASDLYFDSKIYSRLIDENTALYQQPWIEIYKLLLQELKLKK
jgi:hypothetical protein